MMHWEGYTVFSVISGIAMLLMGVAAVGVGVKERLYGIVGGALFLGYGIYVAKQTSGVWVFPVYIFFIPFLTVGYLVFSWYTWMAERPARSASVRVPSRWPSTPRQRHKRGTAPAAARIWTTRWRAALDVAQW